MTLIISYTIQEIKVLLKIVSQWRKRKEIATRIWNFERFLPEHRVAVLIIRHTEAFILINIIT